MTRIGCNLYSFSDYLTSVFFLHFESKRFKFTDWSLWIFLDVDTREMVRLRLHHLHTGLC